MNVVAESERISRNVGVTKRLGKYGARRAISVANRHLKPLGSVPTIGSLDNYNTQLALSTLLAIANDGLGLLHRHQCSVLPALVAAY